MRYKLLIIIFFSNFICNSQLQGRMVHDSNEVMVIDIKILPSGEQYAGDVDGIFSVNIPKTDTIHCVLINAGYMSLKINNLSNDYRNFKLGDIDIPELKSLSVIEYNNIEDIEKAEYIPIYCWANLIGYSNQNVLSRNYISFYCNGIEHQTSNINFDAATRSITIEASELSPCN